MMASTERPDVLRWFQRLAIMVGVACLSWVGVVTLRAELYDHRQRSQFEQQRSASAASSLAGPSSLPATVTRGGVIGLLEIPRLGFSELVVHGDDPDTLSVAIGHLPDTPLPWQEGNSALAGHRDGHFRPLKDIKVGDTITLATRQGTLHYVLRDTKIVMPDDLSVLTPSDTRMLTLITCYPFSFVGNAPKRFIIKAEAVAN